MQARTPQPAASLPRTSPHTVVGLTFEVEESQSAMIPAVVSPSAEGKVERLLKALDFHVS